MVRKACVIICLRPKASSEVAYFTDTRNQQRNTQKSKHPEPGTAFDASLRWTGRVVLIDGNRFLK